MAPRDTWPQPYKYHKYTNGEKNLTIGAVNAAGGGGRSMRKPQRKNGSSACDSQWLMGPKARMGFYCLRFHKTLNIPFYSSNDSNQYYLSFHYNCVGNLLCSLVEGCNNQIYIKKSSLYIFPPFWTDETWFWSAVWVKLKTFWNSWTMAAAVVADLKLFFERIFLKL